LIIQPMLTSENKFKEARNQLFYHHLLIIIGLTTGLLGCKKFEPERIFKVETDQVTELSENTWKAQGTIIDLGEQVISQHGFCYAINRHPTVDNNNGISQLGMATSDGSYSGDLTGLQSASNYYVRAYITNRDSTTYGRSIQFTTRQITGPTVVTAEAHSITETSVIVGGNVNDDGGAAVTERGIYYGTSSDPKSSGIKVPIGSGTGTFSKTLTGLADGTKYYFMAYATNTAGTSFGTTRSFTTLQSYMKPTVTTSSAQSVQETSAIVGGNVSDNGGATVTERGVLYGTSSEPQNSGTKVVIGSGTGPFSTTLTGLLEGITYYFISYATNIAGTSYGTTKSFTTKAVSAVTDYDGNIYQTIVIGSQIWMAENLKVTHYADGTIIPYIENDTNWEALDYSDKAYCNSTDVNTYGRFYTWAGAMNGSTSSDANPSGVQGVCPNGWHLPSDAEWKQLEIYLGLSQAEANDTIWRGTDEGDKLKEAGYSHWEYPNTGTNESGFSALAGGCRGYKGTFINLGWYAHFWTATEFDDSHAWIRVLKYDHKDICRDNARMKYGFSIRCVKD